MSEQLTGKSINVSESTWEKLFLLKVKHRAKSIDDVLEKIMKNEIEVEA